MSEVSRRLSLEKIVQSQGFGSRKECRSLIRSGRVTVAGEVCTDFQAEFAPAGLCFTVDDEEWLYQAQAYLVLHKPAGYECSHRPLHHRSVFSLLPEPLVERGVQSVGRLDADTSGLLLLSDDGAWLHALTSPRRHVPKTYRATLRHPLTSGQCTALTAGVVLRDDPSPVAALAAEAVDTHTLRLTIGEGRYHQVKRMVAAVGNRVEALHRERVGAFSLPPELAEGAWRWLTPAEVAACREVPAVEGESV